MEKMEKTGKVNDGFKEKKWRDYLLTLEDPSEMEDKATRTFEDDKWKDFLLSLKDPSKQKPTKKDGGIKLKRPAETGTVTEPEAKKHKNSSTKDQSKRKETGSTKGADASEEERWNEFLRALKDPTKLNTIKKAGTKLKRVNEPDTVTNTAAKKQKKQQVEKSQTTNETTKCHLLHNGNLPYKVVFETKPNINGVYKIAYEKEAIFVGNTSGNVIKQLRKHFTKHGSSEVYKFMMTLSEDQKQKLTVFWLDETLHEHKCGKSYLKCIEALQGFKPRFNTRKVTNENRDSGSRDGDNTSLPNESPSLFQNDDQNGVVMLEPVGAKTPPKIGSTVQDNVKASALSESSGGWESSSLWTRTTSSAKAIESVPQKLPALSSLQRNQIHSSVKTIMFHGSLPNQQQPKPRNTEAPYLTPELEPTTSINFFSARPEARISPTTKKEKIGNPSRRRNLKKKQSGSSWNLWGGFKRTLSSIWSWMFGQ